MPRDDTRLHIILPRVQPEVDFSACAEKIALGRPFQVLEVWQLGPTGRYDGEPLGWIGCYKAGIAWKMAPGIGGKYARGFEPIGGGADFTAEINACANRVVNTMRLAIEGGKAAERRAGEVLIGSG